MEKDIKEESLFRKVRRHEVNFSTIQGNHSPDYLDSYLFSQSNEPCQDFIDKMVRKIDKRVLRRSMFKLPYKDRQILSGYLLGVKQTVLAEQFNISPSAINQRLEKIFYNYRAILCNDKEFEQTSKWDLFQQDAEFLFVEYMKEVRRTGILKIDLNEVKQLIAETRKAITHSITTKANLNIREQLSKQIDYSNLDDKYIENMNKAFAEQGVEAHFEKLKTFKGNIMQVLKMVDDFIDELYKTAQNKAQEEKN